MASDSYRSDPERAAQLAVYLAIYGETLGAVAVPMRLARVAVAMQKAGRMAKRQAENACNYPMTEEQQTRAARRLAKVQTQLNAELDEMVGHRGPLAPTIALGGDPRGPCATLHIPGQRGDGWGDGFAIY
jgi:hypothetical protein